MKRNFRTVLTASFLTACLSIQTFVAPFLSYINVQASEKQVLTAGVSSVFGQQLFVGRIENENNQKESFVAKTEDALTGSALAQTNEKGEVTICGYHNLGISTADPNLNIRKEPNTSAEIVGKLPKNSACEILDIKDGWAKITSGNAAGWVFLEYLLTGAEAVAKAETLANEVATITTDKLYVRQEPNTDSAKLSYVENGEELIIIAQKDGWYKVEHNNVVGWICGDYVSVSYQLPKGVTISELRFGLGISDERVRLVNFALQYIGGRYVWGGESLTNGVDCSGFTMKVYEQFGYKLPHYSVSQSNCGTRINIADAKPGDLFFYYNPSLGRIDHVAIYIGNGQIVHAASSRLGIIVSNAYYKTPYCVVNIFGD